ncbi:MAG: hypothetical protein ABJB66_09165 [Gemmatimonadaceae bacterium]
MISRRVRAFGKGISLPITRALVIGGAFTLNGVHAQSPATASAIVKSEFLSTAVGFASAHA